ncbi:hypothetical protein ACN20G_11925 [Streptomyces sp. BI20]|uniref:hypothetical protein n=1 Tax=Streptomyces sp. BI20 TaxID=3403460 RepID=UPI003C7284FE
MSRPPEQPGLFPVLSARAPGSQLSLLGPPVPVRIASETWRSWLEDPTCRARFDAKVYRLDGAGCWFWTGAISGTGHASFRAASLPGRTRRGTVPGHLYAYQRAHGVIPRLGWGTENPTVCHRCDNHSCQRPDHMTLGTPAQNRHEWLARRHLTGSPLADLRGPAGRSRAIARAIRTGLDLHEPATRINARINAAADAGQPLQLW